MSRRQNNQLPNNLPQLQNLIKRDPESYREEFLQQLRHFESAKQVFELNPAVDDHHGKISGTMGHSGRTSAADELEELVMFLAQVARCYPDDLAAFPHTLVEMLRKHSTTLSPEMRLTLCRALILLRHKGLLAPADLLQLFFDLLRCQDKPLRKFLRDHIVSDLKTVNSKHKDVRLNTAMQNFMFTMLKDSHKVASKTSLDIMIELYRKNVWRDAKTVNVIATACFSEITKVMVAALKFFLGSSGDDDGDEGDNKGGDDSDSEEDLPTLKEVQMANRVNKKTRKRQRYLENIKKAHKKKKRKEKPEAFSFAALHLVHDPQGFAERAFRKMEGLREKFEVKVMFLDLVSRLIGTHQLLLLPYYAYIARFLNPHQREVVSMLQFAAQASHDMVPPDAVEPVVKAIVNNFVTERNSGEVMAIGLNAMREVARRCPLVIDEALLRDLAAYKSYKDKSVMMAARSLIQLFRGLNPELLQRKDRGRPTEATAEVLRQAGGPRFGQSTAKDFIPGAEALDVQQGQAVVDEEDDDDDGGGSSSSGWEDVVHDSDDDDDDDDDGKKDDGKETQQPQFLTAEEKAEKAKQVSTSRILTDADFKKIDSAQLRKQVQAFRKGKRGKKRAIEPKGDDEGNDDLEGDDYEGDGAELGINGREELVKLANIEMVHKKRKHDKEARLQTVMDGREGREKFSAKKGKMNEFASTTNKQKLKNKNFMMVKSKFKAKAKKSFVQKQKDLKRAMLRSRKFK